jgi:hypothetical protein
MRPPCARTPALRRQPVCLNRGSWISLFAMLMIFIGPLISQSMPMPMPMPMEQRTTALINAPMDRSAMDHADHHAQPAAEHCPAKTSHHAIWEKCGYCNLLFNCPALTGGRSFVAFDTPTATPFGTPATRLGHARPTFFPGARTRAPPIVA